MSNINYAQLVAAARAGDQNAISDLYNSTYQRAYGIARQYVKDEENALDVLQTAYVKAFENLDKLQSPDKFDKWINQIVANGSKDFLKRKTAILFSQMGETDDEPIDFEDDRTEYQPAEAVDYNETKRLVRGILDSLSDEQRLVTLMFYFESLSVKEIAGQLGCSENTIKSRLNYARQKIKTEVLVLEKKGTKLYGLAPIPFFIYILLRSGLLTDITYAAATSVAQGVQSQLAANAAQMAPPSGGYQTPANSGQGGYPQGGGYPQPPPSAGYANVANTATGAVAAGGKAAGAGLALKIIAGVVALAVVVGGGVAVAGTIQNRSQEPSSFAESALEDILDKDEIPAISSSLNIQGDSSSSIITEEASVLNLELLGLLGKTNGDVKALMGEPSAVSMGGYNLIDLKYYKSEFAGGYDGAPELLRIFLRDPNNILTSYYKDPANSGIEFPYSKVPDELVVERIFYINQTDNFSLIFTFEGGYSIENVSMHLGEPYKARNKTEEITGLDGMEAYYMYQDFHFRIFYALMDDGSYLAQSVEVALEPLVEDA